MIYNHCDWSYDGKTQLNYANKQIFKHEWANEQLPDGVWSDCRKSGTIKNLHWNIGPILLCTECMSTTIGSTSISRIISISLQYRY